MSYFHALCVRIFRNCCSRAFHALVSFELSVAFAVLKNFENCVDTLSGLIRVRQP
jgi:hypothetical protein